MNIIELAREAGLPFGERGAIPLWDKELERFATLVRAAALEEAALKCEQYAKHKLEEEMPIAYVYGARECAESIRWMKEQT